MLNAAGNSPILECSDVFIHQTKDEKLFDSSKIARDRKYLAALLSAIGYSDVVVQRIAEMPPAIVAELALLSTSELKPVTLYRGLQIRPSEYNPNMKSVTFQGHTFMSKDFYHAYLYGQGSGNPEWPGGVILEYQLPAKWFATYSGSAATVIPPDHFPESFISRFGMYDFPGEYKARLGMSPHDWDAERDAKQFVQWLPYNEVINDLEKFKLRFGGKQPGAEILLP